jgi:ABC-type nickel/cobalt efflux system permease component RcnA
MVVAIFGGTSLIAAPAASAHPLGNFTINHYSGLVLTPGHVRLTYVLDMAEIPTFQERPAIDSNGDQAVSAAERQAWASRESATILPMLSLKVGGRPVLLAAACGASMEYRPGQGGLAILRMVATFDGPLPSSGSLTYHDGSFPGRIGWKEVTARGDGVALAGASVPARSVSGALLRYPTDLLRNPLSVTDATASFTASGAGAIEPPCPSGATRSPTAAANAFASLVTWRLSPFLLGLSLLLAFAFGAIHAVGPGHGKTITAAYLVGSGAKVRQAVAVGAAVSLMHTASVLTLGIVTAAVSSSFHSEAAYPWLTVATGTVALVLGSCLLVIRIRAKRRGLEPWHGHTHPWEEPATTVPIREPVAVGAGVPETRSGGGSLPVEPPHGHEHEDRWHEHAAPAPRPVSRRGLAALAVSGGILPSPTALVVLLGAIQAHRVGYGLALIVAFSLGLAAALIGVAMIALRARAYVANRIGGRAAVWVPIISAVLIVGFGAYFLLRGVLQLA